MENSRPSKLIVHFFALQKLNEVSSNFSYFKDFFSLKQFSRESGMDYSVNYDCLAQYERNSKQAASFLLNRPLCLFNLEGNADQATYGDENEDYFSVHTSIRLEKANVKSLTTNQAVRDTFIHVASSCHKKRSSSKISAYFDKSNKAANTFQSLKHISLGTNKKKDEDAVNVTHSNPQLFNIQATTHTLFTFKRQSDKETSEMLDSLTINDCLIISEQELQFRIDHDSVPRKKSSYKSAPSQSIDYEIELIMPATQGVVGYDEVVTGRDLKRSKLSEASSVRPIQPTRSFNFTVKKENLTQVWLILLTFYTFGHYLRFENTGHG